MDADYEIQKIAICNPDKTSLVVTVHVTEKLISSATHILDIKPFLQSNSIQDILDQIHAQNPSGELNPRSEDITL